MSASDSVSNAWHLISHNVLGFIGFLTRTETGKATGIKMLGLLPAYFVNAFVSYRDYKFEQNRLRRFYEPEIAAQLGKRPENVTVQDLLTVGKTNPAIADALRRNKSSRWMEFAIGSIAITAAVFLTAGIAAGLAGSAIATFISAIWGGEFLLGMVIGLPSFLAMERVLEPFGKRLLGVAEPELNEVSRHPRLQSEMSVSSQVHYLERMQNHKQTIRPRQVMTLLSTADPVRAARMDPLALEQLTDDLNSRQVRAQELAFLAYGQKSGIPRLESPRVTLLEKVNADLRQKLAAAQEKLGERAGKITDGAKQKLGFRKSEVSMGAPAPQIEETRPQANWTARIAAERQRGQGQQLFVPT